MGVMQTYVVDRHLRVLDFAAASPFASGRDAPVLPGSRPRVAPVSERAGAEWAMSYSSRCTLALSAELPDFPPSVPLAFVVGGNRVGWLVG